MKQPEKNIDESLEKRKQLEMLVSELKFELEEARSLLKEEQEARQFYQLIADFTFSWELWLDPQGNIKYCSPSCSDITGYSANQILDSPSVSELLVYGDDRPGFDGFLSGALNQMPGKTSHEFRILTRTRQLRWCSVNVRGVYDRQGRYLGIRASIHDITRLRRALGHITSLSTGKEMESRNRQRLKAELEMKERELVAYLLQLSRKNELIAQVIRQLEKMLEGKNPLTREPLQKLLQNLEQSSSETIDWEMVESQLENLYPGFMVRLHQKHSRLTSKENKLCACLRLGLTSREIAGLKNISPQSVEIARVRLRKKLKLAGSKRLANYLAEI
ncbi:MAG TPA: PAS domain S-box protein [Mariniphaga anaerophila]|uniref:PAS domain S-box protein n=1 Tax=Mariniphaga anaerophila TaxID=1484053 RepID=A0A831PMM0_9BACT|nr:PAS domain S-box protein [Mariniphaga anaerophila]